MVDALFELIDWSRVSSVLEPCAGIGSIVGRVPELVSVETCELYPTDGRPSRDYLTAEVSHAHLAVTNPPFSLACDFVQKMLDEAETVIVLQRLNFWGSTMRREWWNQLPAVTHQLVVTPRPSFTDGGTDSCEYAWFCWDRRGLLKVPRPFMVLETPKVAR